MVGVRADPGTGSASQPAGRPGSGELPGISVGSAPGPGPVLPASDETLHRRRPGRWILRINRWRCYGHDRLYVQDDFGNAVGWWDLATGTAHEVERGWEAAVAESVESWIARYGAGVSAGSRPGSERAYPGAPSPAGPYGTRRPTHRPGGDAPRGADPRPGLRRGLAILLGGRLPHGQRATPAVRACCPVGGAQGLEAAQQGLPLRGVGVTAGRDRRASPAADQGTDHCSRRDALAKSASGPFWLVQLRKPPTTPPRPTPLRKIGQWPILIGPAEKTDYCPTLPSQNRTTGRLDGAALSAPDPLRPGAAARDPSGEPGQDLRRDPAQRHLATVGAATLTTAAEVGGPAGVREALKVMLKP